MYIQQIGRAGRDGTEAQATMLINSSDISTNVKGLTDSMRHYCQSTSCRRKVLCNFFGYKLESDVPKCCDNCDGISNTGHTAKEHIYVNENIILLIEESLFSYASLDTSGCLSQQLTDEIIRSISRNCKDISNAEDLIKIYSLEKKVAESVFAVLNTVLLGNNNL